MIAPGFPRTRLPASTPLDFLSLPEDSLEFPECVLVFKGSTWLLAHKTHFFARDSYIVFPFLETMTHLKGLTFLTLETVTCFQRRFVFIF